MSEEYRTEGSLDWLNDIMKRLWPKTSKAVEKAVLEKVNPMISKAIPLSLVKFDKFSLGEEAPRFGSIKVCSLSDEGLKIICSLDYDGDIEANISVCGVTAGLRKLHFSADFCIHLQSLLDEFPVIGAVSFYAINQPSLDMDFVGLLNFADWPLISRVVRKKMLRAISEECVLPNRVNCFFTETLNRSLVRSPIPRGVLRLSVKQCQIYEKMDGPFGSADPYVMVRLSDEVFETSVKKGLDVEWEGEEYHFFVYDLEQKLKMSVFDYDSTSRNDHAGDLELTIQELVESSEGRVFLKKGEEAGILCVEGEWLEIGREDEVSESQTAVSHMARVEVANVYIHRALAKKIGLKIKLGEEEKVIHPVEYTKEALERVYRRKMKREIEKMKEKMEEDEIREILNISEEEYLEVLEEDDFPPEAIEISLDNSKHLIVCPKQQLELELINEIGYSVTEPMAIDTENFRGKLEFKSKMGDYLAEADLEIELFPLRLGSVFPG